MPMDAATRIRDREQFTAWAMRNSQERRRERDNWNRYDGTEYRQWDESSLRILIQEGRPPHSFNFTKRYVDTLAGSSLAEPYDIHYETELGESNDIAILFNELYLEDRDLGNFMFQYLQTLRAGFVYRGWLEMFKDYSRGPLPRVGIRYLSADRVVTDPDWNTNDVRDNKGLYLPAWMSPQQIKDKYKKSSLSLDVQIALFKEMQGSGSHDQQEVDKLFDRSPEFWDSQNGLFLVWDKLVLERQTSMQLYDYDTGTWVPAMDSHDEMEAMYEVGRYAGRNIVKMPRERLVCKVYSQCPALLLDLQAGNHPLQLNRYPLFAFSSDTINGRPNTPTDQLKSVQEAVNKRESVKTHILMTSASNHVLVESDAFETPAKAEFFIKNRNRPGGGSIVDAGGIGKIKHLDRAMPPREFLDDINHLWTIGEKLTPSVPATQGIGQEGDSGVLFQAKVAQAQIGMQIPSKFLMALWHDIGDAYFEAASQVYTYPMVFRSQRTGQKFYLNYEGGIDMKTISRLRVTVTQSPASETYRRLLLQTYLSINQTLTSPLSRQALSRLVIQTLPNVPEEEKAVLAGIAKMEEDYQKKVVMFQSMQIDMQIQSLQAQQQAQQMGGMPGQAPAPGQPVNAQALLGQFMGSGGQPQDKPMTTSTV